MDGKGGEDLVGPRPVLVQIKGTDRCLSVWPRGLRTEGGGDGLPEEWLCEWAPVPLPGICLLQHQTRGLWGETYNVHGRTAWGGGRALCRSSQGQELALLSDRGSGRHDETKHHT